MHLYMEDTKPNILKLKQIYYYVNGNCAYAQLL